MSSSTPMLGSPLTQTAASTGCVPHEAAARQQTTGPYGVTRDSSFAGEVRLRVISAVCASGRSPGQRRPDPAPEVFGYHEVFHALVIAAALTHYVVVARYVLPRA